MQHCSWAAVSHKYVRPRVAGGYHHCGNCTLHDRIGTSIVNCILHHRIGISIVCAGGSRAGVDKEYW